MRSGPRVSLAVAVAVAVAAAAVAGCGGDGGSNPDGAGNPDAPASCDLSQANPCPLEPGGPGYQGAGTIGAMTEHVYTFVPAAAGSHVLSGTSSSMTMYFSIDPDLGQPCSQTGTSCQAGDPCSGVPADLVAGTTYYVKVCNETTFTDLPYNVFVTPP